MRQSGQAGMTLVELMVAMVVSMVLLAGVYQIFVASTTASRENEQFARLQENARFAMEVIGRDLRMAGYTGCGNQNGSIINTLNDTGYRYNFNITIEGHDYTGTTGVAATDFTPNLDASIPTTDLVAGNDVLTIRHANVAAPIQLTADMTASTSALTVPNGLTAAQIAANDLFLIADCEASTLFQVTGTPSDGSIEHGSAAAPAVQIGSPLANNPAYPQNSTADLGRQFPDGAELIPVQTDTYFIRNNIVSVPSLYVSNFYNGTNELVQGVEQMQIRYGVDTSGDRQVDAYVNGTGVTNWNEVVAVRVALLMMSDIDVKLPLDSNTYDLDGNGTADYGPINDRRMRRVFKSTFTLRNRAS